VPVAPFLLVPVIVSSAIIIAALSSETVAQSDPESLAPTSSALGIASRLVVTSCLLGMLAAASASCWATDGESALRPFDVVARQRITRALAVKVSCVDKYNRSNCLNQTKQLGDGLTKDQAVAIAGITLREGCDDGNAEACDAISDLFFSRAISTVNEEDVWSYNRRACELGIPGACLRAGRLIADRRHLAATGESAEYFLKKVCALEDESQCKLAEVFLAALTGVVNDLHRACNAAPINSHCLDYYTLTDNIGALKLLCDRENIAIACWNTALGFAKGTIVTADEVASLSYLDKACLYDKRYQPYCNNRSEFIAKTNEDPHKKSDECKKSPEPRLDCMEYYLQNANVPALETLCDNYHHDVACWNAAVLYSAGTVVQRNPERAILLLKKACRWDKDLDGKIHTEPRYQKACNDYQWFLKLGKK